MAYFRSLILVIFIHSFRMTNNIGQYKKEGSISYFSQCKSVYFKMMPTGYYNYVISDRLNTKEKKRNTHTQKKNLFFLLNLLMETIPAEMMKRHLGNHYYKFEHNKLMPPSCRLLFKLEWFFFFNLIGHISMYIFIYLTT